MRSALMGNAVNCNFAHWRGSAHSFPRGEAVAQIGTSEPIWVTDEERRNVKYGFALRKIGRNGTLYPFFWGAFRIPLHRRSSSAPVCALGHLPPGGRYFHRSVTSPNYNSQTSSGRPVFRSHRARRVPSSTVTAASFPVKWLLTPRGKELVRVMSSAS